MNCAEPRRAVARALLLAGVFAAAAATSALAQVAGPIEVGPSWGSADPAQSAATLSTRLVNHGDLADRLIRAECPASGSIALLDGSLHRDVMAPNKEQAAQGAQRRGEQNGLDVPPATDGAPHPLQADFRLTDARQPLTPGAHLPCTLFFAHDGERVVVFTLGVEPPVTREP